MLVRLTPIKPALHRERPEWADRVERRAMAIWPRLDNRSLRRCRGSSTCIAAYVSRRTKMTMKAIEWLIADRLQSES